MKLFHFLRRSAKWGKMQTSLIFCLNEISRFTNTAVPTKLLQARQMLQTMSPRRTNQPSSKHRRLSLLQHQFPLNSANPPTENASPMTPIVIPTLQYSARNSISNLFWENFSFPWDRISRGCFARRLVTKLETRCV